jgi:hypothetical protein
MPISIDGTGTITGLSAGGLPDLSITTADIADSAITTAKIAAGAVVPADLSQPMTSATAVATTSGTAINFTDIPSWVKKVTVMLSSVSVSGSSVVLIQIGDSGGIENTSYIANAVHLQGGASVTSTDYTTGFGLSGDSSSGATLSGSYTISNISGNLWVLAGSARQQSNRIVVAAGEKTLSALLDRVRITTVNGTDTFDLGSVNIIYEG